MRLAARSRLLKLRLRAPSQSRQRRVAVERRRKCRIPRKKKLTVVRAARSSTPASNSQSTAQSACRPFFLFLFRFFLVLSSSSSAPSSRARSSGSRSTQERKWKSCSSIKPHDEFLVWFHSNEYNRYKSVLKAIHVDSHGECWLNGRKLARGQYPSPPMPPTTHGERAAMGDPLYAPSATIGLQDSWVMIFYDPRIICQHTLNSCSFNRVCMAEWVIGARICPSCESKFLL